MPILPASIWGRCRFYASWKKAIELPSSIFELSLGEKKLCEQGQFPTLWTVACRFYKEYEMLNKDPNLASGSEVYARMAEIHLFSKCFEDWNKLQEVSLPF